jgi:uncharacterized protein (TIGR02453 family)
METIFRPGLFDFLRELKANNDRDWFAANKARFEAEVRDPALQFISAATPQLAKLSPHFRGSLFRIYRDTRFSADKAPFKTHLGIRFSHEKGKDAHAPVFYLHLDPEGCFAAAGVWRPDVPTLTKIRTAIVARENEWRKARKLLTGDGERLKTAPRGYDPGHEFVEDLKLKSYVALVDLTPEQICGPKFLREYTAACRKMLPLVEFTTTALGLPF